jgi:hypothetical protein
MNCGLFIADGADISWPSTIVAVALLAFIGSIMIVAIQKYSVDGVIKVWSLLVPCNF